LKKKVLLAILVLSALSIGTVFGAFIVMNFWNTQMSMRLAGSEEYGIIVHWPNGTALTSYDWGEFGFGEMKSIYYRVNNTGSVTYYMTWNATIPSGWTVTVETNYTTPNTSILPNTLFGPIPAGAAPPILMNVTEAGASLGSEYNFELRWYSGGEVTP
jgi:hypothetical protein